MAETMSPMTQSAVTPRVGPSAAAVIRTPILVACTAPGVRGLPAGAPRPSSRRYQPQHRREQCGARGGVCGDQGEAGVDYVAHISECRGAQRHAQHDRQHADGALPAVPHDRELCFAIAAPKETVGGVGEPVLVQSSRKDEPGQSSRDGRPPLRNRWFADSLRLRKPDSNPRSIPRDRFRNFSVECPSHDRAGYRTRARKRVP
jgi:hypothetical protein